ncbi:MAG: ankyrin repeat domain-containing protein [Vicinamibacterales bacterium]
MSLGLSAAVLVSPACRPDVPPLAQSKDAVEKALIEAVRTERVDVVRSLLAAGADPDAIARGTHYEDTALTLACKSGNLALVVMLLGAGANPNLRQGGSNWEFTPLMLASGGGHIEIVQRLLDAGANVQDRQGMFHAQGGGPGVRPVPTLSYAVQYGHTEVARRLILAGASIERTELYSAIVNGHVDIVRLLLRADADPRWILRSGLSVLDEARRSPEPTRAQMVAEVRRFLDGPPRPPE